MRPWRRTDALQLVNVASRLERQGAPARVSSLVLDETGGTLKKTAAAFVALSLYAM